MKALFITRVLGVGTAREERLRGWTRRALDVMRFAAQTGWHTGLLCLAALAAPSLLALWCEGCLSSELSTELRGAVRTSGQLFGMLYFIGIAVTAGFGARRAMVALAASILLLSIGL